MRVYLIIVEEPFFHPAFVRRVLAGVRDEVAGLTVVPDVSGKTFYRFLRYQLRFWGPKGFLVLSAKTAWFRVMRALKRVFPRLPGDYSVAEVARSMGIPVFAAANVNAPDHLDHLRGLGLDVIVSANGQIFRKDLLAVPRIGCINRHSALLPRYGGLWPVFWAAVHGETRVGVSVHWMKVKLDAGDIVAAREIPVEPGDSVCTLYGKAFAVSADVVLEALDAIRAGRMCLKPYRPEEASYFGMPKYEELPALKRKLRIPMF